MTKKGTTFRTSKGVVVSVAYPDIYIQPGYVVPADVTSPAEMREALREELRDNLVINLKANYVPKIEEDIRFVFDQYRASAWGFENINAVTGSTVGLPIPGTMLQSLNSLVHIRDTARINLVRDYVINTFDPSVNLSTFTFSWLLMLDGLVFLFEITEDDAVYRKTVIFANNLLASIGAGNWFYDTFNPATGVGSGNAVAGLLTSAIPFVKLTEITGDPAYKNYHKTLSSTAYNNRVVATNLPYRTYNPASGAGVDTTLGPEDISDPIEGFVSAYLLSGDSDYLTYARTFLEAAETYMYEPAHKMYRRVNCTTGALVDRAFNPWDGTMVKALILMDRVSSLGDSRGNAEDHFKGILYKSFYGWIQSPLSDYGTRTPTGGWPGGGGYPEVFENALLLYGETGDEFYRWVSMKIYDAWRQWCKKTYGFCWVNATSPSTIVNQAQYEWILGENLEFLYLLAAYHDEFPRQVPLLMDGLGVPLMGRMMKP